MYISRFFAEMLENTRKYHAFQRVYKGKMLPMEWFKLSSMQQECPLVQNLGVFVSHRIHVWYIYLHLT